MSTYLPPWYLWKGNKQYPWSIVANNIHEMRFRVQYQRSASLLHVFVWQWHFYRTWLAQWETTDGHTATIQVLYCHMCSWLEHRCHTNDIPLTISNTTHTVWKHNLNSGLIFYIFSTGIPSHILTLLQHFARPIFSPRRRWEDTPAMYPHSYLVRIKVQKHKLDNHQLGYS